MKPYRVTITILIISLCLILFSIICASKNSNAPPTEYQVQAHLISQTESGTRILKDSRGHLWEIENIEIDYDDTLLLEMDNNKTPFDITDDLILQVWKRADSILLNE